MKDIENKNYIIKGSEYKDNLDIGTIALPNAIVVASSRAF